MKRIAVVMFCGLWLAAAGGAGQQKVQVCHLTGPNRGHVLEIAAPAVGAHLGHGDSLEGAFGLPKGAPCSPVRGEAPELPQ